MQEISLEVKIQTAMAAQSVGEIKEQLKELKTAMIQAGEGSAEFDKLAMAAAGLQEKMNAANDSIRAYNPDALEATANFASKAAAGISLVTGAMGLFGDQSKETEKALLKVQSAMAFAQGVQGVKDFGKALNGLFNTILDNPVAAFAIAITALGTAMYKVWSAQQDLNSELAIATREYEKQKEATAALSREYDRQIALLSAQGASTEEIIVVKRKLIEAQIAEAETSLKVNEAKLKEIESNDNLWESLLKVADVVNCTNQAEAAIAQNKKERSAEAIAQIKEQQESLKDLRNQLTILDVEEKKAAKESKKTNAGANADKAQKRTEDRMSHAEYVQLKHDKEEEAHIAERKRKKEAADEGERRRIEDLQNHKAYLDAKREKEYKEYLARKKQRKEERAQDQADKEWKLSMLSSLFSSVSSLMSKNAKAQKAFAVAQTTVDTYMAAQKAYASQLSIPTPDAPIRAQIAAGIAILSGLARVQQILAVDTNGGGAAPSGSFGSGASGSLEMGSPNINASQQPSTLINEQGQVVNQQPTRPMYVSVTEIRQTGDYVQAQEERSSF